MPDDQYGKHLNEVVKQLSAVGFHAVIRCQDAARFVYSKANERAIEIAWAGDAGVYIEYWNGVI